jgi:hypothetical protein
MHLQWHSEQRWISERSSDIPCSIHCAGCLLSLHTINVGPIILLNITPSWCPLLGVRIALLVLFICGNGNFALDLPPI